MAGKRKQAECDPTGHDFSQVHVGSSLTSVPNKVEKLFCRKCGKVVVVK